MNWFIKTVCVGGTRQGPRSLRWMILPALLILLVILLWPSAAPAQAPTTAASSFGPVLTPYTTIAANAPYRVCPIAATGVPCSTVGVSLFSDAQLTHSLSNPGFANSQGIVSFFVAAGFYQVQVTPSPGAMYVYYNNNTPGGGGSGTLSRQIAGYAVAALSLIHISEPTR